MKLRTFDRYKARWTCLVIMQLYSLVLLCRNWWLFWQGFNSYVAIGGYFGNDLILVLQYGVVLVMIPESLNLFWTSVGS